MKLYYKVKGTFETGEPQTVALEATGTSQTRLQDLPVKSALEQLDKLGILEKYEVYITTVSLDDA
jgi:hypothetical protein